MTLYTPEELLEMSDPAFHKAAVEDLKETARSQSAFQDADVIERTMATLLEWLWFTNIKIDERAEDPDCSPELYAGTLKYRQRLLSALDITDRRIAWAQGAKEREVRKWKQVLFTVVDAILEGWDDEDILALKIPSYRNQIGDSYDLETWHEIRLQKEPGRVRAVKEAA